MDRLAIVVKCIDIWCDTNNIKYLQFDRNITSLKGDHLVIKIGEYVGYYSRKVGERISKVYNNVKNTSILKNSFCILYAQNAVWNTRQEYLDCVTYTKELLWNELGTLENPTLEEVDYYIELLNKQW